jgi:heme exporter protein A
MANRQASATTLNIEKLAILRGNRLVLRDFSLSVRSGESVWIKGANGSGKSTLLRTISGLLPHSAGQCHFTGNIALTDENAALDSDQTPDEALRFWGQFDGVDGSRLEAALEALDLVSLADIPIRLLSAGQKRRVALARLIAGGADIWLLDEPYNALDQANVARLDSAISNHCARGGIALIASHIAPRIGVSHSISLDQPAKAVAA